jgi:TonB family protein
MRYLILFFFLLLLQPYSRAQSDSLVTPAVGESLIEEKIFTIVEEMPEFPGGEEALMGYLDSNVSYPTEAINKGIEGTVYVTFVVDKSGEIRNAEILRGIGTECDEDALRVIHLMPNWQPGRHQRMNVNVQYTLPIKFGSYKKKDWKKGITRSLPPKVSDP